MRFTRLKLYEGITAVCEFERFRSFVDALKVFFGFGIVSKALYSEEMLSNSVLRALHQEARQFGR